MTRKQNVSDLTVDDANTLLRTLEEFKVQLEEEDEDLPRGLVDGLEELRKKLQITLVRIVHLNQSVLCSLLSFSYAYVGFYSQRLDPSPGENQDRATYSPSRQRHTGDQLEQFAALLEVAWPRTVHRGPARSDRTG